MLSTAHFFIGGALGALLKRWPAAFCAGIASHHLADCVIHTDTGTYQQGSCDDPRYSPAEATFATVDLVLGMALLCAASRDHPHRREIAAGALGGITPDLLDNSPVIGRRFRATWFGRRYHAMHDRLHRTAEPHEWLAGVITQIIAVMVASALLRR